MKIAISVDEALLREADAAARDLGLSRSGLVARALRDFLEHRALLSIQLNQAYASEQTGEERKLIRRLKTKLPIQNRW